MADVYTPPPDSSYLLGTPFSTPKDSGAVWGIAFSSNSGTLLTAGLSVIFTVIFACLWNLVCFIALSFSRDETRERYVALVTLWNSNDSWFAFRELASYAFHYRKATRDCLYGLSLTAIAIVVYGASLALGIVGPSLIQIGNVAPVRPSRVFYPGTPPPNDYVQILKEFGLRAPGVLRALGSVEAADVTTRRRVNFNDNIDSGTGGDGETIHHLTYSYTITGVEFGLQQGAGLAVTTEGSCTTEYGWISDVQNDRNDVYNLWGDQSQQFEVPINAYDIRNAPKASFQPHPDADAQYTTDGNSSFAIIVWSAHRASISEGSDPWYATELRNSSVPAWYDAHFWMRRSRPVLSCWQKDTWSYGSHTVNSVAGLRDIPGIKVPSVLLDVLEAALTNPVLTRLGNASGDSALRSRTTSPNGVIDARASSISDDMERLLVASFMATRNVFVDATMFKEDETYPNLMRGENGEPQGGAGDFVVSSPEIQTFSLVGLIVLIVMLVVMLLLESVITLLIRTHQQPTGSNNKAHKKNNIWIRFKVLSAVQLFRRIYETEEGDPRNEWPCTLPFPKDEYTSDFGLADCRKDNDYCRGHIQVNAYKPKPLRGQEPNNSPSGQAAAQNRS